MRTADEWRLRRRHVPKRHVRHEHELAIQSFSNGGYEKNGLFPHSSLWWSMGKLAEVAEKIERLEQLLSEANGRIVEQDAQLAIAEVRLAEIRRQTALECLAEIYPDGTPAIAIRRIRGIFGLNG
jgi:hypothetical protein